MSYMEDSVDWQVIELVDEWLDREVAQAYKDQPLAQDWARLSKVIEVIEELGEAISNFISYTGQNPRKPVAHSKDDVVDEVLDVVLTGLLCSQHLLKSPAEVSWRLRQKQGKLYQRMIASEKEREARTT